MQFVLEKTNNKLKIYELPIEYITIIKQNGKYPDYIKEPIILHHQVSRELKNKV